MDVSHEVRRDYSLSLLQHGGLKDNDMKKKNFRLRSQLDADIYKGQTFVKLSLTEPNQAMTTSEILRNFKLTGRTGLFDSPQGAVYDEEGNLEKYRHLDKLEMEDAKRNVSTRLNEYEERLKKHTETPLNETTSPQSESGVALSKQVSEGAETQ